MCSRSIFDEKIEIICQNVNGKNRNINIYHIIKLMGYGASCPREKTNPCVCMLQEVKFGNIVFPANSGFTIEQFDVIHHLVKFNGTLIGIGTCNVGVKIKSPAVEVRQEEWGCMVLWSSYFTVASLLTPKYYNLQSRKVPYERLDQFTFTQFGVRTTHWVGLKLNDRVFHFMSVHASVSKALPFTKMLLAEASQFINERKKGTDFEPVVIAGDFNLSSKSFVPDSPYLLYQNESASPVIQLPNNITMYKFGATHISCMSKDHEPRDIDHMFTGNCSPLINLSVMGIDRDQKIINTHGQDHCMIRAEMPI